MPELPEVETIKNDVREHLLGRTIAAVEVLDPTFIVRPEVDEFARRLSGTTLVTADRKAKYLLIGLSSGDILAVQLIITGQLLLLAPSTAFAKNTRLVLVLDDGNHVRIVDNNGYARAQLLPEAEVERVLRLDQLGPDPTAPDFTYERFATLLRGRRGRIKALLLDQHFLAGLGNIYADEALWLSGIHPARQANTLTEAERRRLYEAIRHVLLTGIAKRGTTIATYRDLLGRKGHNQEELKVFRKTGKPCPRCGTTIELLSLGGRDTHVCPYCQPVDRPSPIFAEDESKGDAAG